MVRDRKQHGPTKIKLAQPDRSGPDPTEGTLLDMARKRGLLDIPEERGAAAEEPLVGRLGDTILWSMSLTMLHFTLDVLVQHQYAVEIKWSSMVTRAFQAFPIIFLFFYILHPHPEPSNLLPMPPRKYQHVLHQLFFSISSVASGCYLIYITNEEPYFAVMKRAPPMGCLWIWSVIELDLLWAIGSLLGSVIFFKWNNYVFL